MSSIVSLNECQVWFLYMNVKYGSYKWLLSIVPVNECLILCL